MKVEIYSDVACPWCYIGKERFQRALESFPGAEQVEVVYRPYQLDPAAPAPAVPMREYLERRFGARAGAMTERVVESAREEGIMMDYDRGLAANTLDAHRLLRLAEREHGAEVQRALKDELLRAHFSAGADVADAETLSRLAGAAGMDPERAREYLVSGEGRNEVTAEIEDARRLGITAVPTFVFDGKYAVQGAQPASAFLQALETVARESAAESGGGQGDGCADGFCAT